MQSVTLIILRQKGTYVNVVMKNSLQKKPVKYLLNTAVLSDYKGVLDLITETPVRVFFDVNNY